MCRHPTPQRQYGHLYPRDPRLRTCSYTKQRKTPTGVLGRPRSPILLAQRRKNARQKYEAALAARGLRRFRLLLSADAAARLIAQARVRRVTPGVIVEELLRGLVTVSQ